jgi:hypothetical protein
VSLLGCLGAPKDSRDLTRQNIHRPYPGDMSEGRVTRLVISNGGWVIMPSGLVRVELHRALHRIGATDAVCD